LTQLQVEIRKVVIYVNLIPQSLAAKIPRLYETEHIPDPTVWVKFFFPDFHWTWYVIEYDGEDLCFGWVDGDARELGYFSLKELTSTRGTLGLPIERDRYFTPCPLSELQKRLQVR
jgi:hypothetical protein